MTQLKRQLSERQLQQTRSRHTDVDKDTEEHAPITSICDFAKQRQSVSGIERHQLKYVPRFVGAQQPVRKQLQCEINTLTPILNTLFSKTFSTTRTIIYKLTCEVLTQFYIS